MINDAMRTLKDEILDTNLFTKMMCIYHSKVPGI